MEQEENSLEISTPDYLEPLGVKVSTDLSLYEENKTGYIKLENEMVGRINLFMQHLPDLIGDAISNSGDVYRVIYDKSKYDLQQAAWKHNGVFHGTLVSKGTNNRIRGQADLLELSMAPQVVNGIFSVMSMVTGQYFMTQINNHLSQIEERVASIQEFLENDKKSKLQSEEEFLKATQKSLLFILENEYQKQSTIASIQKIRIDSLAGVNFYRMQIESSLSVSDKKDKKDKIEDVIKNVYNTCHWIYEYWYSLYLYCFAVYLEPIVAENYNSEYLNMLKDDIFEKCECYKKDYEKWKTSLEEYIETAKAFDSNKILAVLKKIGDNKFVFDPNTLMLKVMVGGITNLADDADKKRKMEGKEEAVDILSMIKNCESIEAIETKQNELMLFDSLFNNQMELIKDHEDIYVKLPM